MKILVWYVEAYEPEAGRPVRVGSAVALRLRKGGKAKNYLLTCGHVIRRDLPNAPGWGRVYEQIRVYPPECGFPSKGIDVAISDLVPFERGDVAKESRDPASDWVLLEGKSVNLPEGARTLVATDVAAGKLENLSVFGFPGGTDWIDENKGVVRAKDVRGFRVTSHSDGIYYSTGPEETRPGMSGGAIIRTGGLVGLHRAFKDSTNSCTAISFSLIRQRLRDDHGIEVIGTSAPSDFEASGGVEQLRDLAPAAAANIISKCDLLEDLAANLPPPAPATPEDLVIRLIKAGAEQSGWILKDAYDVSRHEVKRAIKGLAEVLLPVFEEWRAFAGDSPGKIASLAEVLVAAENGRHCQFAYEDRSVGLQGLTAVSLPIGSDESPNTGIAGPGHPDCLQTLLNYLGERTGLPTTAGQINGRIRSANIRARAGRDADLAFYGIHRRPGSNRERDALSKIRTALPDMILVELGELNHEALDPYVGIFLDGLT